MTQPVRPDEQHAALIEEYRARINRVMDYIERTIDKPFTLEELAGVAAFSPFHFHRIFSAMTGETLARFIQRVRLERAASQLVANPRKTITGIALDCGFSGSATFARAFREAFGVSASEWRATRSKRGNSDRKESQTNGNGGKESPASSMYFDTVTRQFAWRIAMNEIPVKVEVQDFPERTVAYVRHTGPYKGDSALFERLFNKLCTWAGPRNLIIPGETLFFAVYHDNPDITVEDKLRISICLTIPENTPVENDIGMMTIAGGKYAVAHFELQPTQYMEAWNAVYGDWLPQSGYQPDDRPCFEMYQADMMTPDGKHIVDICVPVKLL